MEICSSADRQLTHRVINCVFAVHAALGPGFMEGVYRRALVVELREQGLRADQEVDIQICYRGHIVGAHRLDIVVESVLLLELKAVSTLAGVHYSQVRSYLAASQLRTALLVNFHGERADYRRIERGSVG